MLEFAPNSFMGINQNSPTIQHMMQQNNGFGQQLPFSTTQPIGNIGGLGYNNNGGNPFLQYMNSPQYNQMMNGGYYSGYYNYNPQEIRRQMEEQRRLEEERIRNEINIQKMRARIYNNFHGIETDEEYLEKYYNPNTYSEINKDLNDYEEMRRLAELSNDPSRRIGVNPVIVDTMARISQENRAKHPVDQSFLDYMNTAGDIYREAMINENARELRKNIANTYNREAYNQLANMHRQSSFASLRQNVSVDDLSISLPPHLRGNREYQERKNAFLSYITQNDARNRGGV